jgi:hypothetical protein
MSLDFQFTCLKDIVLLQYLPFYRNVACENCSSDKGLSGIYEYLPMTESSLGLPLGEITRLTQPLQVIGSGFPMKANFSFVVWSKLW